MILKRRTDRPRLRTHRLGDHKHYADDGVGAGDGDEDGDDGADDGADGDEDGEKDESISDFTPVILGCCIIC